MKVITYETLYHEDHGATLKHKCGKRIVTLSLLSFSLIFLGLLFFMAFFLVLSLIPTCGGIIVSIILSSLGQCSNNDDHHTFIYSRLDKADTWWLYECLWRCTGICNESRVTCMKIMKMALPQIQCQLHVHAKSNMTKVMCVIWTEWWKVAWKYISEWLWKCHNR